MLLTVDVCKKSTHLKTQSNIVLYAPKSIVSNDWKFCLVV